MYILLLTRVIHLFSFTFSGWSTLKSSRAFSALANRPLRLNNRLVMWPTSWTCVLNLLASWDLATAFTRSATDTPKVSFTVVSSASAICSSRSTFSFRSNRDTRSACQIKHVILVSWSLQHLFGKNSWIRYLFLLQGSDSIAFRQSDPRKLSMSVVL